MNRLKKIFAMLVCLAMVLTSVTVPALANEDNESTEATNVALGKATAENVVLTMVESSYSNGIAVVTDGAVAVGGNGQQFIGSYHGIFCLDLGESYDVEKVMIDAVSSQFSSNMNVYLANEPYSSSLPANKTVILEGTDEWGVATKTIELETPVNARYIIVHRTAGNAIRLGEIEVWGVESTDDETNNDEEETDDTAATNVALGKPSTASRVSAGIAPYTDLAKITDGVYFANNSQNQYITYGPSMIAIDLEANYLVSKLVVDAVAVNFTKNLEVYVSKAPLNGDAVPGGAVKVLAGEAGGWDAGVKTVELDEAVEGRYVILYMTSNASPSFRLSEVEVWGVPGTDEGGDDEGGDDVGGGDIGGDDDEDDDEPIEFVELATGKAAFAYGSLVGTDPAFAVDGDVDTYWESVTETNGVNKSIVIDLGADCVITKYAVIPKGRGTAKTLKVYGATSAKPDTRVFHKEIQGVFDMNVGKSLEDSLGYISWDGNPTYRYLTIESSNSVFEISDISVMGYVADGTDAMSGSVVRVTDDATIYVSNDTNQFDMQISNFSHRGYIADEDPSNLFGSTQTGDSVVRITYDLGMEMPISHMVYQYLENGMEDYGNNLTLFATNSLDRVFNEDNLDTIAFIGKPVFANKNTGILVFEMPDELKNNKYRYVGIYKTGKYTVGALKRVGASSLYAYTPESVMADLVEGEKGYNILSENASYESGLLAYNASVVAKAGSHKFTGLFGKVGANGEFEETAYGTDTLVRGTAGFDNIEIGAEALSGGVWEGVILDGYDVISVYTDMQAGTKVQSTEFGSATEPALSKIGNSFTISGKGNGAFVGMVVLKPGADVENFTADDIVAHKVVYAPENTKDAWNFNINYTLNSNLAEADYTVALFCDGNAEEISGKTFTVTKIDLDSIVEAFENVTDDNFEALVEANSEFFGETAELLLDSATMAESFILAKAAVEQGLFDQSITEWNVDALAAATMSAIVVDKTMNDSDFAEEIAPYIGSMPDVFGKDYDADEFEKIFPAVLKEDGADNAEELVDAYKKANVLSIIANGTKKEIEKAIEENSELLGISASTLEKVSPIQIAKNMDTKLETVVKHYVSGMDDVALDIAKKLKDNSGSGGKVLGGGGSGGGSGLVASVPSNLPEVDRNETAVDEGNNVTAAAYNDLAGFDWAKDSIVKLSERGIMNGKGYGTFDPSGRLTREEAVKLLVTATGTPTDESYNGYDDCVIGSWYYPYITAAKINGLVTGFSRTQFGLGNNVTRQDLAVMIYRAMQKQNLVKAVDAASFADEAEIADYAVEAVKILGGMGIITGLEDGSFAPAASATRAEAAVIFARYIEFSENAAEEGAE